MGAAPSEGVAETAEVAATAEEAAEAEAAGVEREGTAATAAPAARRLAVTPHTAAVCSQQHTCAGIGYGSEVLRAGVGSHWRLA